MQTTMNIPILWYANAGTPLAVAESNDYGTLPISKSLIKWNEKNHFVLRVSGSSMNEQIVNGKTIDNGSYVLIEKTNVNLNESDAFLFEVDGWATLKRYKKNAQQIYLIPNSSEDHHTPIVLSEHDNVHASWKVVDVFTF